MYNLLHTFAVMYNQLTVSYAWIIHRCRGMEKYHHPRTVRISWVLAGNFQYNHTNFEI